MLDVARGQKVGIQHALEKLPYFYKKEGSMRPQTRMTRQRMVILEELRKVRTHPTADELYALVRERIPRISLGTVYRNLDFLSESGEILKLEAAGNTRRFDGFTHPHQHIRCKVCGCVGDVEPVQPVPDAHGIQVEGFHVVNVRMEFEGVCAACAASIEYAPRRAEASPASYAMQRDR